MKTEIIVYLLDHFGKSSTFIIISLAEVVCWPIEESIFLPGMAMKIEEHKDALTFLDLIGQILNQKDLRV